MASFDVLVEDGMSLLADGLAEDALLLFDRALAAQPDRKPELWQRGLALWYTSQFEEGAKQFHSDLDVNASDVE